MEWGLMQSDSQGDANIFGNKVELRSVKQNDFELLFGWLNDPEVYRWWGGTPIDSEVIRQKYVGLRRPQVEGYIIEVTGIPVGYVQRHQTGESEGSIDLFLVPEMRGSGYGSDAVRTLVEFLMQREGWTKIAVDPERENLLAQRFWRKLGFVETEENTLEGRTLLILDGNLRKSPDGGSL